MRRRPASQLRPVKPVTASAGPGRRRGACPGPSAPRRRPAVARGGVACRPSPAASSAPRTCSSLNCSPASCCALASAATCLSGCTCSAARLKACLTSSLLMGPSSAAVAGAWGEGRGGRWWWWGVCVCVGGGWMMRGARSGGMRRRAGCRGLWGRGAVVCTQPGRQPTFHPDAQQAVVSQHVAAPAAMLPRPAARRAARPAPGCAVVVREVGVRLAGGGAVLGKALALALLVLLLPAPAAGGARGGGGGLRERRSQAQEERG